MKFALIIVFVGYKLGGITTVDFEDKEACEAGKAQIAAHFKGALESAAERLRADNMICVPKGRQ